MITRTRASTERRGGFHATVIVLCACLVTMLVATAWLSGTGQTGVPGSFPTDLHRGSGHNADRLPADALADRSDSGGRVLLPPVPAPAPAHRPSVARKKELWTGEGPEEDRDAYRGLCQLAKNRGVVLSGPEQLTDAQWTEIRGIHGMFWPKLQSLYLHRVDRLGVIRKTRQDAGSLERVALEGLADDARRKATDMAQAPTVPGQSVQMVWGPDGAFVNRVSPGEDAELDSIMATIDHTTASYVDAATRVLR